MRKIRWALAAIGLLLSLPAVAVSLGGIQVQSSLYQPLRASIPIAGLTAGMQDNLHAEMASEAAFQRAGLRKEAFYNDIKLSIQPGSGGNARLLLSSDKRMSEPFLSFIVNLDWANGSVQREYTVLLDPPNYAADEGSAAAPAPQNQPQAGGHGAELPVHSVDTQTAATPAAEMDTAPAPRRHAAASAGGVRHYGPTVPQETLWSIAYALRRDPSINMDQMMLAIYRANRGDFDGNIGRMYKGVTLTIPDAASIRAIDPAAASAEIARQKRALRGGGSSSHQRSSRAPVRHHRHSHAAPVQTKAAPAAEVSTTVAGEGNTQTAASPTQSSAAASGGKLAAQAPPAIAPDAKGAGAAPAATQTQAAAVNGQEQSGASTAAAGMPAATTSGGTATNAAGAEQTAANPANSQGNADLSKPSIWANDSSGGNPAQPQPAAGGTATGAAAAPAKPAVETAPAATPPIKEKPAGGGVLAQLQNLVAGLNLDLASLKPFLLGLLALVAALFGYRYYRKRKEADAEAQAATMTMPAFRPADLESPAPSDPTEIWDANAADEHAAGPDHSQTAAAADTDLIDPDQAVVGTAAGAAGLAAQNDYPVRDTDYLGEAELHIAYGLYDEAAAVLERGVEENPQRKDLWMKLIEVYAEAGRADDVVNAAERFKREAHPDAAQWQRVCTLGASLAPDAEIFAGASAQAGTAKAQTAAAATGKPATTLAPQSTDLQLDAPGPEVRGKVDDAALDFNLEELELPAPAATGSAVKSSASADQEAFDIDLSSFDAEPSKPAGVSPAAAHAPARPAREKAEAESEAGLTMLEPDTAAIASPAPPRPEPGGKHDDLELAAVDELDDFVAQTAPAKSTVSEPETAVPEPAPAPLLERDTEIDEDESSVKLDLARAYIDMGEHDMARSLLEEVQRSGSEQQRREAGEQLGRL